MKNFGTVIEKLNFRKIVKTYIIFTLVVILLSCAVLGYAYRNKIIFDYRFNQVAEKMEHNNVSVKAVKSNITKLARQSSDVVDILTLNKKNKIIDSAKNSKFAEYKYFRLNQKSYGDYLYFTYAHDSDITFKLMKRDELMLSTVLLNLDMQLQNNYRDNIFYKKDLNLKKVYLLSYTFDERTGNKIYFITNVHTVPYGQTCLNAVIAALILCLMLYWILLASWVFMDSKKSKANFMLWGIIALCTNIAGLFIYLIYKQNNQTCPHCHALQRKGSIYCAHCGTQINRICGYCNKITSEGDKFCRHCGNALNH